MIFLFFVFVHALLLFSHLFKLIVHIIKGFVTVQCFLGDAVLVLYYVLVHVLVFTAPQLFVLVFGGLGGLDCIGFLVTFLYFLGSFGGIVIVCVLGHFIILFCVLILLYVLVHVHVLFHPNFFVLCFCASLEFC